MIYLARYTDKKIVELIGKNLNLSYKEFIEKTGIDISDKMYSYHRRKTFGVKNKNPKPANLDATNFIRENSNMEYYELEKILKEKFNYELHRATYRRICNKGITNTKWFTKDQKEFLKENHLKKNLVELFNNKFNTNYNQESLYSKLRDMGLGIKKQTSIWLKENYKDLNSNELKFLYNKTFNDDLNRTEMYRKCYGFNLKCKKDDLFAIYLDDNEQSSENMVYVNRNVMVSYKRNKLISNNLELNQVRLKCAMIQDKINNLSCE